MSKGSRVVYSSIVESFGVEHPPSTYPRNEDNELLLSDLPFEVIRTIATYLDSFRYTRSVSFNSFDSSAV